MEAGIVTQVCYAAVFGDVIGVEEMASRLGAAGDAEFSTALEKLQQERRIVLAHGFAALPGGEEKISAKAAKIALADRLIGSRMTELRRLGRSVIIKFVGISGSLAAKNPTRDRNECLDIDVFLITRRQCLWLYMIPRNLRIFFSRRKSDLRFCDNFIMDESNLRVANRNFFTATDIWNLIPVSGFDTYQTFLRANRWVGYYYPGLVDCAVEEPNRRVRAPLNKAFFVIYKLLQCLRHGTLTPLRNLSFTADATSATNVDRLHVKYGGYQAMVSAKFSELAARWFPGLIDAELIRKLFPDSLSVAIRQGKFDVAKLDVEQVLGVDYSKYA